MRRLLFTLTIAMTLAATSVAYADPSFYSGPIFGIATASDGSLLVADANAAGSSSRVVSVNASGPTVVASLPPGYGISDVAPIAGGGMWAVTGGENGTLFRISAAGVAVKVADIAAFEQKRNPHPTLLESNAFDVADLGGGEALVADAAGNDLVLVDKHGKVKLVAVLPDELVPTAFVKTVAGCPTPPPDFAFVCDLPAMYPAEAVATSVAVGPDGAYYVGELKGFPAPAGYSRVWRIDPHARNARCGQSPKCSVVVEGLTSVIDVAFGPNGQLYVAQIDDATFFALEGLVPPQGGSVRRCAPATGSCAVVVAGVPMLTSITFRTDGTLWGVINALIPGAADVVQLTAAP
jgi:hypothetical protein